MEGSRTILGLPYREDDRVISLANFIAEHLKTANIEIEAKIGSFKFQENSLNVPHALEIDPYKIYSKFDSSLQPLMFYSLLDHLKHTCRDFKYSETEDHLYLSSEVDTKLRQTIDRNGQVLETIRKTRLADKNFAINNSGLGVRFSANYEEVLSELPAGSRFSIIRKKKRHAFAYSYLEVDLTEVSMNNKLSYEVEIEIKDFNFVRVHIENFNTGKDKGPLIGIARKIWQNALAIGLHRPRASVVRVVENEELMKTRDEAYEEIIGEVKPVIGDYLYCCALERRNGEMVS